MPSRGSPNGARHTRPQPDRDGRDRPEQVVVIDWNDWSSSIGTGGRHHPVRAHLVGNELRIGAERLCNASELGHVRFPHRLRVLFGSGANWIEDALIQRQTL